MPSRSGILGASGACQKNVLAFVEISGPTDWNRDGSSPSPSLAVDSNNLGGICNAGGSELNGYDDWSNPVYDMRACNDFVTGNRNSADEFKEPTGKEFKAGSPDSAGDGIVDLKDNGPFTRNATQEDDDHSGVGSAWQRHPHAAIDNPVRKRPSLHLRTQELRPLAVDLVKAEGLVDRGKAVAAIHYLELCLEQVNTHRADAAQRVQTHATVSNRNHLQLLHAAGQGLADIEAASYRHH